MIYRFYKYLYYRLYSWNLKTWGESDMPQFNAMLGVSFMMFLNLGFIASIIDLFWCKVFVKETPKVEIIVLMLIIIAINYFLFVHKGKYKSIKKEYKNESKKKRFWKALLLWLYIILSFFILGLMATISGRMKGNL